MLDGKQWVKEPSTQWVNKNEKGHGVDHRPAMWGVTYINLFL